MFMRFNRYLMMFVLIFFISACSEAPPHDLTEEVPQPPKVTDIEPAPIEVEAEEPLSYTTEASLLAVGDIMAHYPQTRGAFDPDTQTYNFDYSFTEIKGLLSSGD